MKCVGGTWHRGNTVDCRRLHLTHLRHAILCIKLIFYSYAATRATAQGLAQESVDSILQSLRAAGLTSSADAIQAAVISGSITLPSSNFTIFAPVNQAVDSILPSNPDLSKVLNYHLATTDLPHKALLLLPIGQRIPTLLPDNTLLVTDNNLANYSINNEQILYFDLCTVYTVSCHAVSGILNSTIWGQASLIGPATSPSAAPAGAPFIAPFAAPIGAPYTSPAGAPYAPPPESALPPVIGIPPTVPGAPETPPGIIPPTVPGAPETPPGNIPRTAGSPPPPGQDRAAAATALLISVFFI
ncbi:uncharacterized protein [Physcomitrium patens]|uniref:FAS1 domain-containing protein n=1 Tax=Physcomitrium patens TaxID=3218 RepID=A0A2K1KE99_PHYPA|nr:mucin-7-like [Physcomitrium patens]PNR52069.1 hypothetical protein PHYPA_008443 [Physcomitrium patens]|eukprot:XP_024378953.1 mucin-7-like [Physcomitrella patens]